VAVLTENSCSSKFSIPIVKELFLAYAKKYHALAVSQNEDKKK